MSDEEHYPDELQFQKNSEFAVLNYDRVGAGRDEGNSQTSFNKPCNKLLINLDRSVVTGKSQTSAYRQEYPTTVSKKIHRTVCLTLPECRYVNLV